MKGSQKKPGQVAATTAGLSPAEIEAVVEGNLRNFLWNHNLHSPRSKKIHSMQQSNPASNNQSVFSGVKPDDSIGKANARVRLFNSHGIKAANNSKLDHLRLKMRDQMNFFQSPPVPRPTRTNPVQINPVQHKAGADKGGAAPQRMSSSLAEQKQNETIETVANAQKRQFASFVERFKSQQERIMQTDSSALIVPLIQQQAGMMVPMSPNMNNIKFLDGQNDTKKVNNNSSSVSSSYKDFKASKVKKLSVHTHPYQQRPWPEEQERVLQAQWSLSKNQGANSQLLNLPPIQAYDVGVPTYSPLPGGLRGSKLHLMQSVSKQSSQHNEVVDGNEYRDQRFDMTASSEVNTQAPMIVQQLASSMRKSSSLRCSVSRNSRGDLQQSISRDDINNIIAITRKLTPNTLLIKRNQQEDAIDEVIMSNEQITQAQSGTIEMGHSSTQLSHVPQNATVSKQQRQSKKEDSMKEKLMAHSWQSQLTLQEVDDDTVVARTGSFILRRFEPKKKTQVSKKIKKAYGILSQGKELDILMKQNILGMLSNLTHPQLHDFLYGEKSANMTLLQLQILNQSTNAQLDKDMLYACYLPGLKRYFKAFGLSAKQQVKVEKLIDQNDHKRTDVRRIHIKFTRDQALGYKLDKTAGVAAGDTLSPRQSPRQSQLKQLKSLTLNKTESVVTSTGKGDKEDDENAFLSKFELKRPNAPLIQTQYDRQIKEISSRYAPLHELKMQSKVEGLDIGLEQIVVEHKKLFQVEQAKLRALNFKQKQEQRAENNQNEEEKDSNPYTLPQRHSRLIDAQAPNWRKTLAKKQIELAGGVRGSQASFGTVNRLLNEKQKEEVFGPSQPPEDQRWLRNPGIKLAPSTLVYKDYSKLRGSIEESDDQPQMESPENTSRKLPLINKGLKQHQTPQQLPPKRHSQQFLLPSEAKKNNKSALMKVPQSLETTNIAADMRKLAYNTDSSNDSLNFVRSADKKEQKRGLLGQRVIQRAIGMAGSQDIYLTQDVQTHRTASIQDAESTIAKLQSLRQSPRIRQPFATQKESPLRQQLVHQVMSNFDRDQRQSNHSNVFAPSVNPRVISNKMVGYGRQKRSSVLSGSQAVKATASHESNCAHTASKPNHHSSLSNTTPSVTLKKHPALQQAQRQASQVRNPFQSAIVKVNSASHSPPAFKQQSSAASPMQIPSYRKHIQ